MNFSFRITRLGDRNKRCQLYTIVKDGERLAEAHKFVQNPENQKSSDFNRLQTRLNKIKDRNGARIQYFKPEGTQYDLVHALHAGARKRGYLQLNHLRWYVIRLSERCVILGNGGVKHVGKTQESEHLMEKESEMRWVDKVVEAAQRNGDLVEDHYGNLIGDLEFITDRFVQYGLQ